VSNTKGSSNTAGGFETLYWNTTGTNNTAVGYQAGEFYNATTKTGLPTTGSYSTFLGAGATALADGLINATAIGFVATVSESNALVLGSSKTQNNFGDTKVGIDVPNPSNIFTG